MKNLHQQRKQDRPLIEPFSWDTSCFYCGKEFSHIDQKEISSVTTSNLRENILNTCQHRLEDSYFSSIAHRVQNCSDLLAEKARYHRLCASKFSKLNQKQNDLASEADEKPSRKPGKPKDPIASDAFDKTCAWLESSAEPLSLQEVEEYMSGMTPESHMWSRRYIQYKLMEKYGDDIDIISEGYRNIVCLRNLAKRLINDKWYNDRNLNYEDEKMRIVQAAAKIIKDERTHVSLSAGHKCFNDLERSCLKGVDS